MTRAPGLLPMLLYFQADLVLKVGAEAKSRADGGDNALDAMVLYI